jgi:aspartate kinase
VIVLKFGGSSVDTPAAVARVGGLVRDRLAEQPVLVVSAMAKTTRRLLECAEAAAAGNLAAALAGYEEVRAFHREIGAAVVPASARARLAAALERSCDGLRSLLDQVATARRLSPRCADQAAAYGELLSSEILALALPAHGVAAAWLDCRQVIVTDAEFTRARPCEEQTAARLRQAIGPLAARGHVAVVGGYVGATADGITTTLGKEGSDFSAALVGAALGAREIQLWTDVDGILTADPRLVAAARPVRTLSFAESLELACAGAKKPHPGTLGPARRGGVPIRILNSHQPQAAGTLIGNRAEAPPTIKSIACRSHSHLLFVRPRGGPRSDAADATVPADAAAAGGGDGRSFTGEALAGVLAIAERFRPTLLVLAAGAGGVELGISSGERGELGDREDRLPEVRAALAEVAEVGVVHGRAVVSLVSEDLATSPELLACTLAAGAGLAPRLVTAGAAAPAVRCLVEEEDLPAVVTLLHGRVFGAAGEVIP